MGSRKTIKITIGLVVSAVFVAWSLKGKPLGQIWAELRAANYWSLIPCLAILIVMYLLRTVRWGMLLAPIDKPPLGRLNAASAVGLMALVLLPLRLGEFGRPFLIRRAGTISGSEAMASVVAERALDGFFVAGLLGLTLLGLPAGPRFAWALQSSRALLLTLVMVLALLALAAWRSALASSVIRATIGRVRPALAEQICRRLAGLVKGLRALPSPASVPGIVALTALYWAANALATWVLARGFALPLTLVQASYCVAVRAIGVALPSGPGMLGTFQAFTELGLAPFVPPGKQADAAAFANVLWAVQFVQQVSLGLIFLGSRHLFVDHRPLTLGRLMRAGEKPEAPASPPAGGSGSSSAGTRESGGGQATRD